MTTTLVEQAFSPGTTTEGSSVGWIRTAQYFHKIVDLTVSWLAMLDNAEGNPGFKTQIGIQCVHFTSLQRQYKRSAVALRSFLILFLIARGIWTTLIFLDILVSSFRDPPQNSSIFGMLHWNHRSVFRILTPHVSATGCCWEQSWARRH